MKQPIVVFQDPLRSLNDAYQFLFLVCVSVWEFPRCGCLHVLDGDLCSCFLFTGSSTPVKLRAKGKDIASSSTFTVLSEKKLFLGQKVGH